MTNPEQREWKIAECFMVNYYPDLGKEFPRFRDSWNHGQRSSFRVTGFYRQYVRPVKPPSDDPKENWLEEMLNRIELDDHNEKTEMEKMKHRFSVVLEQCRFEDAEFIYGQSVSYPMVPIEWCEFIGDVGWEQKMIDEDRQHYIDGLERQKEFNDISRHRTTNPRFDDAVTQLVQGGLEGWNRPSDDEYHYFDQWCEKFANKPYFEVLSPDDDDDDDLEDNDD